MRVEEQVCSLELAKQLKRAGVKQESLLCHIEHVQIKDWDYTECKGIRTWAEAREYYPAEYWNRYAAFTVAELGEMLLEKGFSLPFVEHYSHEQGKCWKFLDPFTEYAESKIVLDRIEKMTEADARAKFLIYLLENKLASPAEGKEGE